MPVEPQHLGVHAGFIDEYQPGRIKIAAATVAEKLIRAVHIECSAGASLSLVANALLDKPDVTLRALVHRFLGTEHLRRIHVVHDGLYPGL